MKVIYIPLLLISTVGLSACLDLNLGEQSNKNSMNIIFEEEADLDMDGSNEIISVAKPKEQDVRNFDIIITIHRIINGKISLWQENTLMFKDPINGCMMDGFEEIALHPNGFDIEYTSCYDNKHAIRSVSFSYKPQIDDFEVTKNTISFFSPESDGKNQYFDCKDHKYLFSSYSGLCEWW